MRKTIEGYSVCLAVYYFGNPPEACLPFPPTVKLNGPEHVNQKDFVFCMFRLHIRYVYEA